MKYNWMKLAMTVGGSVLVAVVGQGLLPEGWSTGIVAVITAVSALHLEPPHQ